MNSKLKLAVHGAGGRMGRRVVALAIDEPGVDLVADRTFR
jgi:dihydrodipicolinate reductase